MIPVHCAWGLFIARPGGHEGRSESKYGKGNDVEEVL